MDVRTTASVPHAEFFPAPHAPGSPGRWVGLLRRDRVELIKFWPVVQNMVVQELRVRYQRSVLGFFWTLLNPILMMATLSLVFSQFLIVPIKNYPVYIFSGMVPWSFLALSLTDCATCIITNEGLIRKIYLPKLIFPLARTLINLVTFLLSLGALFVLVKPLGAPISFSLLALPVVIGLLFAFTLGMGMVIATANTFYRDAGHLVSVFLQAWYFATPIIYNVNGLPADIQWRFWLNPAYPFVRMFHSILSDGLFPELSTLCIATAIATASLGIGYATFKSHEDKLVFRL
jgi:ABC-type polysaccharide/polyol phosphate export permease